MSPANGTSVIFTDTFFIGGIPTSGTLSVLADDTASVTLNGVLLTPLASSTNNTYATCSYYTIGCIASTMGTVDLTSELQTGANTLSIDVKQIAGSSFGLDYSGAVNFAPTPEPGTLVLFGLPLVALSLIRRRKVKA